MTKSRGYPVEIPEKQKCGCGNTMENELEIKQYIFHSAYHKLLNDICMVNEKISYFTFDQKSMRIYIITRSGKLLECSI